METGAFGKENYNLTGYFNLPKVLEITLNNGVDPRTGKQHWPRDRRPAELCDLRRTSSPPIERQLNHFIDIKMRGNQVIERLYATHLPVPFLSLLIDDCIATGQGLSRRRRALQHQLHSGRGPGHDDRCAGGHQVPCL